MDLLPLSELQIHPFNFSNSHPENISMLKLFWLLDLHLKINAIFLLYQKIEIQIIDDTK